MGKGYKTFLVVCILGICMLCNACAGVVEQEDTNSLEQENESETVESETAEEWTISKVENENWDYKPRIHNIKENEDAELIHEDERYQYYLEYSISQSIIIVFENGIKENVKDAISSGKVDIYDLGREHVGCFVIDKTLTEGENPQLINLVDSGWGVDLASQKFYEDENYEYYFSTQAKNFIFAYYTDGTRETIDKALEADRIKIEDLEQYGISYHTQPKHSEVAVREIEWEPLDTDRKLPKIFNIHDAESAELIYEDESYEYYFEVARSEDIKVIYEDNTKENVKDALAAGRIDIYDLGDAGIPVFVIDKNFKDGDTPKLINIVDATIGADMAAEKFYEDDVYQYFFSSSHSPMTFAYYTDGTRENIKTALTSGRATAEDMSYYGINYYKIANIVDVVDLTKHEDIECTQEREYFFENSAFNSKFYFDCAKSMYIELHYKGGMVETLQEAIAAGRIHYYNVLDFKTLYGLEFHEESID